MVHVYIQCIGSSSFNSCPVDFLVWFQIIQFHQHRAGHWWLRPRAINVSESRAWRHGHGSWVTTSLTHNSQLWTLSTVDKHKSQLKNRRIQFLSSQHRVRTYGRVVAEYVYARSLRYQLQVYIYKGRDDWSIFKSARFFSRPIREKENFEGLHGFQQQ